MMHPLEPPALFSMGADPELFLRKAGQYVAVQPYVAGTKEAPQPLPNGGNAQRDNVAIEFGMKPASNKFEFVTYVSQSINDLFDLLPSDVSMHPVASAMFSNKELRHKETKMFGCNVDYNAWTMRENPPPNTKANRRFRSCGGHLHWGYIHGSEYIFLLDEEGKGLLIRTADCIIGSVATVLDNNQAAIDRRQLYGKAGCYRPTSYGVEYRTLSNFWVKSPTLVELMYSLSKDTMEAMADGIGQDLINTIGADNIQSIVSEGKADMAKAVVDELLVDVISAESLALYNKCLPVIDSFNFEDEWRNV